MNMEASGPQSTALPWLGTVTLKWANDSDPETRADISRLMSLASVRNLPCNEHIVAMYRFTVSTLKAIQ